MRVFVDKVQVDLKRIAYCKIYYLATRCIYTCSQNQIVKEPPWLSLWSSKLSMHPASVRLLGQCTGIPGSFCPTWRIAQNDRTDEQVSPTLIQSKGTKERLKETKVKEEKETAKKREERVRYILQAGQQDGSGRQIKGHRLFYLPRSDSIHDMYTGEKLFSVC